MQYKVIQITQSRITLQMNNHKIICNKSLLDPFGLLEIGEVLYTSPTKFPLLYRNDTNKREKA